MDKCYACKFSSMEPDDMNLVCNHKDTKSSVGVYVHRATAEGAHCGPDRLKFEQHPLRSPSGAILPVREMGDQERLEFLAANKDAFNNLKFDTPSGEFDMAQDADRFTDAIARAFQIPKEYLRSPDGRSAGQIFLDVAKMTPDQQLEEMKRIRDRVEKEVSE